MQPALGFLEMSALVLVMMLVMMPGLAGAATNHLVYWNTSNPIFRLDNLDHIVSVNERPGDYDQLDLVCPHSAACSGGGGVEQHVVYSVTEQEYRACRVTSPRPRIVAVCNKAAADKEDYFTITFRAFSPTPGGLEFKPGQTYYFISTSTARDLFRRAGGYCASHNMKMIFNVAAATHPPPASTSSGQDMNNTSGRPFSLPPPMLPELRRQTHRQRWPLEGQQPAGWQSLDDTSISKPRWRTESKIEARLRPSDYLYYYTPRDLLHLKMAVAGGGKRANPAVVGGAAKRANPADENETWKAERLTSRTEAVRPSHMPVLLTSVLALLCATTAFL